MESLATQLARIQRLQMLMGEAADGKKIGKYKSVPYALRKQQQNPLAGFMNVDLRLTGYLHGETVIDVRANSVVFENADSKADKVFEKFGGEERILGLNEKNASEFSKQHLAPEALKRIKQKINR